MKTIEEEKLELIKNAKAGAIDDFTRMSATLEEIIERVVHYAYDAGYEKRILDYISGNVPDL